MKNILRDVLVSKPGKRYPMHGIRPIGVLVALLTVVLAACSQAASPDIPTAKDNLGKSPASGNEGTAADSKIWPTPVDEADAAWIYARCIRENGYPEWPDPLPDGRIMVRRDQGMSMNDPQRIAAMEACQDLRPPGLGSGGGGIGHGGINLGDEESRLAFAQCMRENGVPEFPDPSSGGGRMVISTESGINPNDPKFQKAQRTCLEAMTAEGR